jgi:hypothetical protein
LREYYLLLKNKKYKEIRITNYNFLKNYQKIDAKVLITTLNIILRRTKENNFKADFRYLLYHIEDSIETITFFNNNISLLKKIYFYQIGTDPMDYNKKVFIFIIKRDENFIIEYLNFEFNKDKYISSREEHGDFKVLWDLDNYEKIMSNALESCLRNSINNRYIKVFFKGIPFSGRVEKFIKDYIKKSINNLQKLNFIFSIVTDNFSDSRLKLLRYIFEEVDSDFKNFEKLPLETNMRSYSGSAIPIYEKHKAFWEEVEILLKEFAKTEHILYVKNEIAHWENRIRNELKNDFIEEF